MASAPVKINEHIRQIESTRKEFFEEEKMKISNTWNIFTDTNIIAPNLNFF